MVQTPELKTMKIDTTLELKPDQTLAIGEVSPDAKKGQPFMMLISLKRAMP
jgi:hypothetical protein